MRGPIGLFGLASLFAFAFICFYYWDSPLGYAVLAALVAGGGWLAWRKLKSTTRLGGDSFRGDLPPHVRRALGPKDEGPQR